MNAWNTKSYGEMLRGRALLRWAALWLFIATLALSPFPLGGGIAWASGLQSMLVAASVLLWSVGDLGRTKSDASDSHHVLLPLSLSLLVLLWAGIQILPCVPESWIHPVWGMASDTIGRPISGTISLNPWHTETQLLKLGSYVMVAWFVFRVAQQAEIASVLLNAIIIIGAFYSLYALGLELLKIQQVNIFYSVPYRSSFVSGPFMLHNSFATYCGLAATAAVVKLFASGNQYVVADRGAKRFALSILQFCFGRGAPLLVAVILTFGGVIISASRAGFAATMCSFFTVALLAVSLVRGRTSLRAGIGAFLIAVPLLFIVALSGDALVSRIGQLLVSDTGDAVRYSLWGAARRMITASPWLGLGLGTFEDAYPMYSVGMSPYVMDKAHSDYLEFAAGIGLPAAIAWWCAQVWLAGLCLRAVFIRHRHRLYAIAALGATVLVAIHSSVDFSLQMPAVALLYATLLGIGISQCQPTRNQRIGK